MELIEQLQQIYQDVNVKVTWKAVLVTAGIGGATYTLYCFFVKPFLSPLRKIPGPGYNPLFGNVREAMVGEAMQTSVGWVKKYGGIIRFYHLFGRERVLVADPKALKKIMVTDVDTFDKMMSLNARILGSGIFNAVGKAHRDQRLLMNPFFNHQQITVYMEIFNSKSQQLIDIWKSKNMEGPLDRTEIIVQEDFLRMALDIIGESVFGYDFKSLEDPNSEVNAAFRIVFGQQNISFSRLIPYYYKLPTKHNREMNKSLSLLDGIIYGIIEKKKEMSTNDNDSDTTCNDFLGKLITAKDATTGQGFTDRELRDQVMSLLIAGHETTSITMSWLLLLLAQNQDVQDRVRSEIQQYTDGQSIITWEQVDKLTYLNAVIKEGQRLYPVAPSIYRRVVKDTELCGYHIPKGTIVAYHIGAMMRNPELWPNPEKFDPERFLKDVDLYHHLPFIAGPHKCLGHQFAKMEMRVVLANLLREFKFEVKPGSKFIRKMTVLLTAKPPVSLLVSQIT